MENNNSFIVIQEKHFEIEKNILYNFGGEAPEPWFIY